MRPKHQEAASALSDYLCSREAVGTTDGNGTQSDKWQDGRTETSTEAESPKSGELTHGPAGRASLWLLILDSRVRIAP
jgi:hypothetical protein